MEVNINLEKLLKYRLVDMLDVKDIAILFDCSTDTISRRLKEYDIYPGIWRQKRYDDHWNVTGKGKWVRV